MEDRQRGVGRAGVASARLVIGNLMIGSGKRIGDRFGNRFTTEVGGQTANSAVVSPEGFRIPP
jgi:hypothetical protein